MSKETNLLNLIATEILDTNPWMESNGYDYCFYCGRCPDYWQRGENGYQIPKECLENHADNCAYALCLDWLGGESRAQKAIEDLEKINAG